MNAKLAVYNELIEKAENKISYLQSELHVEQHYLSRLIEARDNIAEPLPEKPQNDNGHSMNGSGLRSGRVPGFLVEALKQSGKPMHVRELAEKLESMGVRTKSDKGLAPVISAAIAKNKNLFAKVERGIYKLA